MQANEVKFGQIISVAKLNEGLIVKSCINSRFRNHPPSVKRLRWIKIVPYQELSVEAACIAMLTP